MDEGRAPQFVRDDRLMEVLTEINGLLGDLKRPAVSGLKHPIIFVVGCPRSGSTLLMQWIASLGVFAYPSNLVARFYENPYFGVRVQQALYTFDSKKQIIPEQTSGDAYRSSYGHTTGALAPSEFWYFWRRFFQFGDSQKIENFHTSNQKTTEFVEELARMEQAFSMPLAMKAMILNWNLPELYALFDKCLLIDVSRQPEENAESLYFSRQDFFNDTEKWYSFKPPAYEWLKELPALEQVAGQVFYTRQAIEQGLEKIPTHSVLRVSHEEFCGNPAETYRQIKTKLQYMGTEIPEYHGIQKFEKTSTSRMSTADRAVIAAYLSHLQKENPIG
jgi:hypothetical protein